MRVLCHRELNCGKLTTRVPPTSILAHLPIGSCFLRVALPTHCPNSLAFQLRCAVALMLAVCCAWPSEGAARSTKRRQTVLILRVEGAAASDVQRRALTRALARKAKKYKHYRVLVSKSDLVEEMFEFECTEAGVECLSKIGRKYRADMVVYSEVTKGENEVWKWAMRVVEMKSKSSPIARVAQSTVRTLASLDKAKKSAAGGLLVLIGPVDLPENRSVSPATLHVRLIGGGVALVYVNEKLAGRSSLSGLKIQLQPGKYTLKVVRAGYKDWSQIVTLRPGQTADRIVELQQLPRAKVAKKAGAATATPITKKWWFWTGIVAAGTAVAVTVWAVSRQDDAKEFGNAAFSLDSNDAHLDPVFGGG